MTQSESARASLTFLSLDLVCTPVLRSEKFGQEDANSGASMVVELEDPQTRFLLLLEYLVKQVQELFWSLFLSLFSSLFIEC